MKKQRKSGINTREKLLKAASDVFADKSYHDATIAEICEKAEANIAAVNYHFNDKETLYREAWRYAFDASIIKYPFDGDVRDGAPPEERLRGQITALLHRIADEDNKEFLIAQKEFVNPTGLLNEVMREELEPMHDRTETVGSRITRFTGLGRRCSILCNKHHKPVCQSDRHEKEKEQQTTAGQLKARRE